MFLFIYISNLFYHYNLYFFRYDEDYSLGICQVKVAGSQCDSELDCSLAMNHSICDKGVCKCDKGYAKKQT